MRDETLSTETGRVLTTFVDVHRAHPIAAASLLRNVTGYLERMKSWTGF